MEKNPSAHPVDDSFERIGLSIDLALKNAHAPASIKGIGIGPADNLEEAEFRVILPDCDKILCTPLSKVIAEGISMYLYSNECQRTIEIALGRLSFVNRDTD